MKRTKAAARWLAVARTVLITGNYLKLLDYAQAIAKERGARLLSKVHCELALARMGGES